MKPFPSSPELIDQRIGAYDLIYDSFDSSLRAAGGVFASDAVRSAITEGLTQTVDAYVCFGATYPLATYYHASAYTLQENGMNSRTAHAWSTELLLKLDALPEDIAAIHDEK